jgi:uncharacterized delta-60 repeat protein
VKDIALQSDGKVLIAGSFTKVGGASVRGIARLLPTGLLDSSFNIGTGVNGVVNAVVLTPEGKVLIGGDFTMVNGIPRTRIALLNADGTVDESFNPAGVPNSAVNAILVAHGRIYIGGDFTTIGASVRNRLARLTFDGSLDPEFDPGSGPNRSVYALAMQSNGQLLVAGAFSTVNGFSTGGIARLNGDQSTAGQVQISGLSRFGSNIQFSYTTEVGLTYIVEGSDDLRNWQSLETRVATSTSTSFSAPNSGHHKFYRVRINP